LIDAIGNCGPREDSTRIGSGGVVKRQAVDVSSFRRVNQGIYFIANCTRNKGMRTIKHISEILADEIMAAAKNSPNCASVKKREEIEKNAKANR
jgi:small subunit ribosomal protein S5e